MTSSLAREPCGPCLETSLQDEHDLSDDDLKHDPARGGRKQDGLAISGDALHLSTQMTANKLVARTTLMQVTGLSHPSFFCPPISRTWHEGMPSFLAGGGEIEMRLLQWEVPGLCTCQERRATREQYPPGMISATSHFKMWTRCLPGASRVEITNDDAQCTKCINVY